MDNARAKEIAAQIIADNPALNVLEERHRLWLLNDIASALRTADFEGEARMAAQWTKSVTQQ
jgi:hypothetical protein